MPYTYKKNSDGTFVCEHCGKTTVHQSTMYYHYQRKHGQAQSLTCQTCNFQAMTQQILDLHIESRHPVEAQQENNQKYECSFPGCTFKDIRKGNLVTHFMRVHMTEETNAILERRKTDGTQEFFCKTCEESKKSLGSFLYHSVTCITLPQNDPRYTMLIQIL